MKINPTIKRLFTIFSIGCVTGTNFFCGKPALAEEELPIERVDTLISSLVPIQFMWKYIYRFSKTLQNHQTTLKHSFLGLHRILCRLADFGKWEQ